MEGEQDDEEMEPITAEIEITLHPTWLAVTTCLVRHALIEKHMLNRNVITTIAQTQECAI